MINKAESKDEKSKVVLRGAFKEYYFKYSNTIAAPARMHEREFGFMHFCSGMIRHLSFNTKGELLAYLLKDVPSDIYCSNAYYRSPTLPMQEKQWLGADLIFDIDAKDLGLECEVHHTYSKCQYCNNIYQGKRQQQPCQNCNMEKFTDIVLPCANCIDRLRKEVQKLYGFLVSDLGIKESLIHIYFSGNNGFHLHVPDERFIHLDSIARSDIAGFILGKGFMPENIGVRKYGDDFLIKFPKSGISYGWRHRIAEKFKIDKSSSVRLKNIVSQKGGYDGFKKEIDNITSEAGAKIDSQVTTDIHRVFRMPGSLNSKSGLAKILCNDIKVFDPFSDACLLSDREIDIEVNVNVKIRLKGESFNIKQQFIRLPVFAAVYLICKGIARAV